MVHANPSSREPARRSPSGLGRAWNRIRAWRRSRRLRVVYSSLYRVNLGATPIDVQRSERILGYLLSYGFLSPDRLLRPESASLAELRLAHGRRYLEALRRPESLRAIIGYDAWPELHQQALLAQRAAVGGTILATLEVLERAGIAVNLGGGFHHASRSRGAGFCIFNDVAVAIANARRQGFAGSVLVVDLDLHDGNGTRDIFAQDDSVFTFSVHNQTWDARPAGASRSVELGAQVEDPEYLAALDRHLPEIFEETRPELVFYLAGTDIAADDKLGNWRISAAGMLARDRRVVERIERQRPSPATVILLAGGYGQNSWRYSARFLAWFLTRRDRIEPPSTFDITMARYRQLADQLRRVPDPEKGKDLSDWSLSEEDILGSVGGGASPPLFLGHFSHHAVELTLEWTGILDRLRQMGFAHPTVDLDLEGSDGHTVRLFADSEHRELLMELRLRIDRRSISGMVLLGLDWLLLQNPRATFTDRQHRLPGQSHPGLGLVADIISLLILLSDQLQLDGIVFVPSHYHLALKGRRFLKFVDAENEGWFRALQAALRGRPLAEATRVVEARAVVDARTGEAVEWRPMQMVIPISERLHDLVEEPSYEATAEAVARELEFEIGESLDKFRNGRPSPVERGSEPGSR